MDLGTFSISLNVKDLAKSKAFYESLGFIEFHSGDNYHIMVNGPTKIGIFYGMFEGNILTFNPGMGDDGSQLADFEDIRDIRAELDGSDVEFDTDLNPDETGPAHLAFVDPDGNAILIDQFFPKPGTNG
jgi:catechol 2,3-dioxygenase-like lactoylglutathione lyase family enzyme